MTIVDYLNIKLKNKMLPIPWIKYPEIAQISSRNYLITMDEKKVLYIDKKGIEC